MQIRLGEKIRTLRKQKGLSQDVLASALGVSFQAVSKWEKADSMPDVTLIPAIASFFGVSTDELFDFDIYKAEEEVIKICNRAIAVREERPEEAEEILREGLKQYPRNDTILLNLLYILQAKNQSEEAINTCRAIIETTKIDDIRYDSWRILAEIYSEKGEYALMKDALTHIPEFYFTRTELEALLLRGEERFEPLCKHLRMSADWTVDSLVMLADFYEENGEVDKAAIQLGIAGGVIESFREEFNHGDFFTGTLWDNRQEELVELKKRIDQCENGRCGDIK